MKYLLVSLGGVEVWDGIITHILAGSNLVSEANPLMAPIVKQGDFLLFKVIGAFLCVLILWYLYKWFPKVTLAVTSGIFVFYMAVVIWNLQVVFDRLVL